MHTLVCAPSLLELDKNAQYLPKTFCIDNSLAVTSGNLLTFYFLLLQLRVREHQVFGPYVEDLSTYAASSYPDVEVTTLVTG